jgi:hypothetical protein
MDAGEGKLCNIMQGGVRADKKRREQDKSRQGANKRHKEHERHKGYKGTDTMGPR